MRYFSFGLLLTFFCFPGHADEIQKYLNLDFAYYEISTSSKQDLKSNIDKAKVSVKTPAKFKKLLMENLCAFNIATSSALIINNSDRLLKLLEALVKDQVMSEYLGGRQIHHFSITNQILQAQGHDAQNSVSIEIHYKDGKSSFYPAPALRDREKGSNASCIFYKEVELFGFIESALLQDIDLKYKRHGIDGETELKYLTLYILGQADSWAHVADMDHIDLEKDKQVCGWIKYQLNNLSYYMYCLEEQAFKRYFLLKTQLLDVSEDVATLETFNTNVLAWVNETAVVLESFARQWGHLSTNHSGR